MTIKLSEISLADKILTILGKKRGVIVPSEELNKFGPYSYAVVKKESFLKALFRPANQPLPSGMVEIHTIILQQKIPNKTIGAKE